MGDRSVRRVWQALAAGCCLASSVVWLTAATAGGHPAGRSHTHPTVRVLQLNLCESGIADCFTGRAVAVAAAVIRHERPDIVTLNEVCRNDVLVLARAMSAGHRGMRVASVFKAAVDRRTGTAFRCLNGQRYGIGVLALLRPAASAHRSYGGVYPSQDLADPEERVWLCVEVPARFLACTTHTASTSTAVALAQCRFFLRAAVPALRSRAGDVPVILGADLNLRSGRLPGPQSCLPHGYERVGDGGVQDIVTSEARAPLTRTVIDMRGATDHPGLLLELAVPRHVSQ